MAIPIEDNYDDILGKAQRGLELTDSQLAGEAKVTIQQLRSVAEGAFDESVVRKLAPVLGLSAEALVVSGRKSWRPEPVEMAGLEVFTTPFHDMTVNAYLAWNPATNVAAAFDSGADCSEMLNSISDHGLTLERVLLTHTHGDHVFDVDRLVSRTGATLHVSRLEPFDGAKLFDEGATFKVGGLTITTRLTAGHSRGGTTFVLDGLAKPVAIVGDSIFAGSMGGGMVSYADALRNNRDKILTLPDETILCPGHGPLTTVGEENLHNPFFAD